MPDRETVIRQIERMKEDAYVSAVFGDAIDDALAMIDTQHKLIIELQNLISIGTKMMNGDGA